MANVDPPKSDMLEQACLLIGRFLYEFSQMERAIDENISKLFELSPEYGAVINTNIDISRKVDILQSALILQMKLSDQAAIKELENLFSSIRVINNPFRTMIAHGYFEPSDRGEVLFKGLRSRPGKQANERSIRRDDFEAKFAELRKITGKLRIILKTVKPYRSVDNTKALTSSEIRDAVSILARKIRVFEADGKREMSDHNFEEGWFESLRAKTHERELVWRNDLRPQAAALLEELRCRIGIIVPSEWMVDEPGNDSLYYSPVEFGLLGGMSPIGAVAGEMERLSRLLDRDENLEVSK